MSKQLLEAGKEKPQRWLGPDCHSILLVVIFLVWYWIIHFFIKQTLQVAKDIASDETLTQHQNVFDLIKKNNRGICSNGNTRKDGPDTGIKRDFNDNCSLGSCLRCPLCHSLLPCCSGTLIFFFFASTRSPFM